MLVHAPRRSKGFHFMEQPKSDLRFALEELSDLLKNT